MSHNHVPSKHVRPIPHERRGASLHGRVEAFDATPEVQLREYWRVIFKYRVLIFSTALLCVLFGLLFVFTTTPRYSASARVRISTYEPVLTGAGAEDALKQKSNDSRYIETQIQEIRSLSLADTVLSDEEIRSAIANQNRPGFFASLFGASRNSSQQLDEVGGYSHPISLIQAYLQGITVRPIRKTSLVVISATSTNPAIAAKMANAHSQSYINWVRTVRVKQQARGLQFLRDQSDELKLRVSDLEHELADYAEANSIVALNKDENITVQRMAQLNELLTESTADRIEIQKEYDEAKLALREDAAAYDDVGIQNMKSRLARLEGEYSEMAAKFKPTYPKMKQLQSQIAGLKIAIREQRRQILRGMRAKTLAAVEEEAQLKEELEQQKSRAFELSKRQVQYNVLSRELGSSRELLTNIERQSKETSLAVESKSSNVSIVDLAVTPSMASYPRKKLTLFITGLFGLALGTGLAFLLSYLDNTLRTPEDLERVVRLPCLGVVPAFELEDANEEVEPKRLDERIEKSVSEPGNELPLVPVEQQNPLVFVSEPKGLAAEAYRTIRTGLLLSQAGEPPRTILVTSSQSSEGKTTMTLNLAASLSSAGGRVVLLDADLRRPRVQKALGLQENLPGLVDVITGTRTIDEVLVSTEVQRVSVIPSGPIPPNPAELLGSFDMAKLIDNLAAHFDYVLIDSPPVLPVTDAVILSRYVDGVVLVVKGGMTPQRVVLDARNRLEGVGATMLGVVLNDVDVTGGDYYYYNRYYYSYEQYQSDGDATRRNSRG
jgi:capsular exopolysaccharide synthesis family protein